MPEISARAGGGIAMVGRSLLRLLAAKEQEAAIDYRVLSLGNPADASDAEQLHRWVGDRLKCFGSRRAAFCLSCMWAMTGWADLAVFTHLGLASMLAVFPLPRRASTLTWIHGLDIWRKLKLRQKLGIRRSDVLVSNSEFTAEKARQWHPWLPPIRPCPLGVVPRASTDRQQWDPGAGFSPAPHDVVIVGRMGKGEIGKGHRELIAAMPRVVEAVPDARLLIVGSGNDVATFRQLAAQSAASGRILFTGFLDDDPLRDVYHRAGVLAMPSRQEGFGLVYAEAMLAGLPCVASNCDAGQEVVVDGQTGYVVDPDDPEALATALIRLLADDGLRERMGDEGKRRALELFTERQFHQRFWQVVEPMLAGAAKETA